MITSVKIENLRGVQEGELVGLTPLTVLTGPNGCGKSTVLDALLIGASKAPGAAVGRAVSRHPGSVAGGRFLVPATAYCRLHLFSDTPGNKGAWIREISRYDDATEPILAEKAARRGLNEPRTTLDVIDAYGRGFPGVPVVVGQNNRWVAAEEQFESGAPSVHLIDPGLPVPLAEAFSSVVRANDKDVLVDLLRSIVPDATDIELLDDGLSLRRGGSLVPVALSGDGIQSALQTAVELSRVPNGGLALIEEPEVYQHPRALRATARVIVAAVKRQVQVVLTTHSQELIDDLLACAEDLPSDSVSVFNLRLSDGELHAVRRSGDELRFARDAVGMDLR